MDITVLREERKMGLEVLETKKALVKGFEAKFEALRSDGSRLLAESSKPIEAVPQKSAKAVIDTREEIAKLGG